MNNTSSDSLALLTNAVWQDCASCGEVISPARFADIVNRTEGDYNVEFSDSDMLKSRREGINQWLDGAIQNARDTSLSEYYTEQDRDRAVSDFEAMRPEAVRAEHIKALLEPASEPVELTRISNDVNGNGRLVAHFLALLTHEEQKSGSLGELYAKALAKARKIGGRKYVTKTFGGGIVFTGYESEVRAGIAKLLA